MYCQNCGSNLKNILPTNICPHCGIQVCPKCGSDDWDPELLPPENKNDTVCLVFGLKPYAKCSRCGNLFKQSMLIEEERKAKGLRVLSASQYRVWKNTYRFGLFFVILCTVGIVDSWLIQETSITPFFAVCGIAGFIAFVIGKYMLSDK